MKKLCLIGCGRISKRHVEALAAAKKLVEVIGFCDIEKEKAEEAAKHYAWLTNSSEIPSTYSNYHTMIEELEPDIVSIATDSGSHAEIGLNAIEAGCHTLIEKPIALHIEDAHRLVEASQKHSLKLGVCYQNRFNLPVEKTFRALTAGRFGKILYGTASVRWNRNNDYYRAAPWRGTWDKDGGALMNQCTHCIDLLRWLLTTGTASEISEVYGTLNRFMRPIEAEDFGAAILSFKNGTRGIIEGTSCIYPRNLEESLSIFGEKGTVRITGLALERIDVWRFSDGKDNESDVLREQSDEPPPTVYGFGHNALYRDFLDSIEYNRSPVADGMQGLKSLELNLAIYRSALDHKPVDFPLRNFGTTDMKNFNFN